MNSVVHVYNSVSDWLICCKACRGRRYDAGVEVDEDVVDAAAVTNVPRRRIPIEADMLLAYSVVPGQCPYGTALAITCDEDVGRV